jgi:predicted dinucleotide-utilizing enzyme
MEKLKVGIIGAGRIGQVHAKSITYHIPQAEIVAISDIYVEGAKKVAQELGIPNYYEDYHEILNNPEINAVLICSSTDTHADIAIESAKAGKNIFCEKPVDLKKLRLLSRLLTRQALSFKSALTVVMTITLLQSKTLLIRAKSVNYKQSKSHLVTLSHLRFHTLRYQVVSSLI